MKKTTLIALGLTPQLLADTSLFIDTSLFMDPYEFGANIFSSFFWNDDLIWDGGSVPSSSCQVDMSATIDDYGEVIRVQLQLVEPTTIGGLNIEFDNEIITNGHNFFVTGTTDSTAGGFLYCRGSTMSLGTYANYNSATKTLSAGSGHLVEEGTASQPGILEFREADIVNLDSGFNLFGVNTVVRDQNTGLNAFRNLAACNRFINIGDGYHLNIAGNFTINNFGSILTQNFAGDRPPRVTIGGNLINNGENDLTLNNNLTFNGGRSTMTIEGNLTNNDSLIIIKGDKTEITITGDILQTGGKVDTGPSGIDSFTMKARAGFYENNACISGNGTLNMPVNINNSFLTPGNSPGELTIDGDLTITGASDLEIELGGTIQGKTYDHISQTNGTTTLGGTLTIKVIDDYDCELTNDDVFTIFTSDSPLAGSFSNVANGSRLADADNFGTFLVNYGSDSNSVNTVVLSDFQANPVTQETFTEWSVNQGFATPDPDADQNNNGITDLLDYAFQGSLPSFSKIQTTGGDFIWTFGLPKTVTGVSITSIKFTDFLGSSTSGPTPVPSGTSASKNLFTLTDFSAAASTPKQFYQLQVTLNE